MAAVGEDVVGTHIDGKMLESLYPRIPAIKASVDSLIILKKPFI